MTTTDPPQESVHVLIVEDSLVQSQALRISLESPGYRVDMAANGAEASNGFVHCRRQSSSLTSRCRRWMVPSFVRH